MQHDSRFFHMPFISKATFVKKVPLRNPTNTDLSWNDIIKKANPKKQG